MAKRWTVEIAPGVARQFEADMKSGLLTADDLVVFKSWLRVIDEEGPDALQKSSFWNDHELFDEWSGHRSSSFSLRGRIIYRIVEKRVEVSVLKITKTHDYSKS